MSDNDIDEVDKTKEEEKELEEFSSVGGGSITGYTLPLGKKPNYDKSRKSNDSNIVYAPKKNKPASKKSKSYLNKSPQYYIKKGGEKSRKRTLKEYIEFYIKRNINNH